MNGRLGNGTWPIDNIANLFLYSQPARPADFGLWQKSAFARPHPTCPGVRCVLLMGASWTASGGAFAFYDCQPLDPGPLLARVVAVADTFDAMMVDRPYWAALDVGTAFAAIVGGAGGQFDPRCAQAFLRLRPQIEAHLGWTALRSLV